VLVILTRLPSSKLLHAELTHLARSTIDYKLSAIQHKQYCEALKKTNLDVCILPALDDYPDSVFVEDVLISLPEVSILCRPGALSRRGEVEFIAEHLPKDRPIVRIQAPASIDGGDVLRIGNRLFIGESTRTNHAAINAISQAVSHFGYSVTAVKVTGALHLKTAVTAISNDLLLMNPHWIDINPFSGWRRIEVADNEPFASNSLVITEKVFMQAAHVATAEKICNGGFDVHMIDISEFSKAEAGLTCMSVIIQPLQ
jgi:dimethylargininase